mgnify:CR=1 FL=1
MNYGGSELVAQILSQKSIPGNLWEPWASWDPQVPGNPGILGIPENLGNFETEISEIPRISETPGIPQTHVFTKHFTQCSFWKSDCQNPKRERYFSDNVGKYEKGTIFEFWCHY